MCIDLERESDAYSRERETGWEWEEKWRRVLGFWFEERSGNRRLYIGFFNWRRFRERGLDLEVFTERPLILNFEDRGITESFLFWEWIVSRQFSTFVNIGKYQFRKTALGLAWSPTNDLGGKEEAQMKSFNRGFLIHGLS